MTGLHLDTASGVRLDLDNPRPADIRLDDVAGALSRICRFGAQTVRFYSVAQHAVLVADLVAKAGHPDLALIALHHDSHEAFACDLPTPLKRRIDRESNDYYTRLTGTLDEAIDAAFGLSGLRHVEEVEAVIRAADGKALLIEAQALLHDGGAGLRRDRGVSEAEVESLPPLDPTLPSEEAEQLFRAAHEGWSAAATTRTCRLLRHP